MRKFIKLVILFSTPFLIGIISLELVLRNIPNDYSFKRKHLDKKSNCIEVLFLGNSHFYYGINPVYMTSKSFNAAHISQSLNFDLAILEKYSDKWKDLQYIIIPIDYFSMYTTLENGIENWRVKNYNIYYDIYTYSSFWNNFEVANGKSLYNISRAKKYLYNQKSDITCNGFGFGTNYNSKDSQDLKETGKTAAKRHTVDIIDKITFYNNIQTIQSIIKFSKKQSVKLIFVTCPAYSTYRENLNYSQLNNTRSIIKQLSASNKNVYYYNLLTDTAFVSTDYYDADHLNNIGAKKLTLKIDSIINTIKSTNSQQGFAKKTGVVL